MLAGISLLFFVMIRGLVLAVFLAAIFAGLVHPFYAWILSRVRGKRALASALTIAVLFFGVAVPVGSILTVAVTEAVQVAQGVEAWLDGGARVEQWRALVARIPFADRVVPQGDELVQAVLDVTAHAGSFLWGTFTGAARGTASFLLQLFVLLYALFFFLMSGAETLGMALAYLPLSAPEKERLLERFVSVAKATLKGSFLLGVIQGSMAGLAFWAAGVPGAAFWGATTVFFAILPAVGAGIIWVPVVIYLLSTGQVVAGVILLAWCVLVVSTIDNILRPRLIGRDAGMSDLMILLSTLGGLALFGAVGFIVGPIVAAMFITGWDIYGEAFFDWPLKRAESGTGDAGAE